MINDTRRFALLLAACLALLISCAAPPPAEPSADYPSPLKFEKDIAKFEAADEQAMPPQGAVVVAGSSSVRMWHGQLAQDLAPLTVVGRGFGGSNMNDLLYYSDRIILKYQPRAVVIYEGDNDIAQGVSPTLIAQTFEKLLDKIDKARPGCRVYILAVKPSLKRWAMWPQMQALNKRFAAIAKSNPNVTYLDIATPMLGDDGTPNPALFVNDGLHLNRAGYELWRDTIRPVLIEAEQRHER